MREASPSAPAELTPPPAPATARSGDPWTAAHASRGWRRALMFGLVAGTTVLGTYGMIDIVIANEPSWSEVLALLLFAVNFAWISSSFWTAMAGVVLRALRRDPITLGPLTVDDRSVDQVALDTRSALVMPIYHEDVERVFAGLEATYRSLAATGQLAHFDVFVLSDTRRPEIAEAEEAAWRALVERVDGAGRIFYRRRTRNTNRKAGNIQEFCENWGSRYENMVVLDADSVMDGALVVRLARAMQLNPKVGIIQTLPIATGRETFFARFVQFATRLNGPALSTGLAFWQLGEGNYWGHNAIIRVAPFMAHCGLPPLPGQAPFGGDILSHDFVEAALMLRGGWGVWLLPQAVTAGSYEEVPSNIVDFAQRDRRWCQGNLQHLGLWGTPGLRPLSRLHLAMGVYAYLSPLTWLVLLALSMFSIVHEAVVPAQYFPPEPTLFPVWPVSKNTEQIGLYILSMALLLLPKLGSALLVVLDRDERRGFGGVFRLAGSLVVEVLFAVLVAPVMMLFHSSFVIQTLMRRHVGWSAQPRSDRGLSVREVWLRHRVHTAIGVVATAVLALLAPRYLSWMSPVLVGLILAMPISWAASRTDLGRWFRRRGLLLTPEETRPPAVLLSMAEIQARGVFAEAHAPTSGEHMPAAVPPLQPGRMPAQSLDSVGATHGVPEGAREIEPAS